MVRMKRYLIEFTANFDTMHTIVHISVNTTSVYSAKELAKVRLVKERPEDYSKFILTRLEVEEK